MPHMKKPGAVSRAGGSTDWRIKKAVLGQARIGAQFVSFNFLNRLICGAASRMLKIG
jgi:hypothetical protein